MFRVLVSALFLSMAPVVSAFAQGVSGFAMSQGVWSVETRFTDENGEWGEPAASHASGQTTLGGAFHELDVAVPFPGAVFQMRMSLGYDRFNQRYRVVVLDDLNGYTDLYDGEGEAGAPIQVTNLNSGTGFPTSEGGYVFGRLTFEDTETGFAILAESAVDGGESWAPFMRMVFEPRN